MYTLFSPHRHQSEVERLFLNSPTDSPSSERLDHYFPFKKALKAGPKRNKLLEVRTDGVRTRTASSHRHRDLGGCDAFVPFLPGTHWPVRETNS